MKKYNITIGEMMNFFCQSHEGYGDEDIQSAEEKVGARLPKDYREYLLAYGADEINTAHNYLMPPGEICTTYQIIADELEEWQPEFEEAIQEGKQEKYADNGCFQLAQLPPSEWGKVTENYVLIWSENQGVWNAGYLLRDLQEGKVNPPVYRSTEDDFITFAACACETEGFLWEMILGAAWSDQADRFTEVEEIGEVLSKAGVDLAQLRVEFSYPNGTTYSFGTCLDGKNHQAYLYYANEDYTELIVAYGNAEAKPVEISLPLSIVVPKKHIPKRFLLTAEQQVEVNDAKIDHGIPLHPLLAPAIKNSTGRLPSIRYDLAKVKRLEVVRYTCDYFHTNDSIGLKVLEKLMKPFYYDEKDWSAISEMTNLTKLSLQGLFVDDFSFLLTCKKIEVLDISFTNFTDCRLLAEMPNLKKINLSHCELEYKEVLASLYIEEEGESGTYSRLR